MQCCVCVKQSDVGIIEACGKYNHVAGPGCHCLVPCRDRVLRMTLRLTESTFSITSKTKDNMFVTCDVVVQSQVIPDAVVNAFYSLEHPQSQIESYLQHSVRSKVAMYSMEELFIERNTIAAQCKEELDHVMERYGYDVVNVLILQVTPDRAILQALNDIQVKTYLRQAAQLGADAKKLRVIKAAEAQAEASRLSGEGLAAQRKAIIAGLQKAVEEFQSQVHDVSPSDVMSLLLMNQYYDCLKEVGGAVQPTLVLIHGSGITDIAQRMEEGVIHPKKA